MSKVGENIRRFRIRAGLSQNKLARLAGISQPALSAIEKEDNNPSSATVELLANALCVSVSELIGESPADGALTAQERQLISAYRSLTAQGREYIRQQIYVATQLYSGNAGVPGVENQKEG